MEQFQCGMQAAGWVAWVWDCPHRAGLDDLGVLLGAPPALPPPQAAAHQQQHCGTACCASAQKPFGDDGV